MPSSSCCWSWSADAACVCIAETPPAAAPFSIPPCCCCCVCMCVCVYMHTHLHAYMHATNQACMHAYMQASTNSLTAYGRRHQDPQNKPAAGVAQKSGESAAESLPPAPSTLDSAAPPAAVPAACTHPLDTPASRVREQTRARAQAGATGGACVLVVHGCDACSAVKSPACCCCCIWVISCEHCACPAATSQETRKNDRVQYVMPGPHMLLGQRARKLHARGLPDQAHCPSSPSSAYTTRLRHSLPVPAGTSSAAGSSTAAAPGSADGAAAVSAAAEMPAAVATARAATWLPMRSSLQQPRATALFPRPPPPSLP